MKTRYIILATLAVLAVTACTTTQIQKADAALAPVLASAAQSAADSYVATGTVNKAVLTNAALSGVGAIAQAYVGQPVTAAPLASGAGVSAQDQHIGQAIVARLPVGTITQELVNQVFAAAALTAPK